jgi:hypothetical protein
MIFKTIMIRVRGNEISEKYARYCAKTWAGFDLRLYDAITPNTLQRQSGLTFGTRSNGRELTDTEKACFYSQYNLWKKCAVENVPILILEHDAYLEKPGAIEFNPHLMVQFFGQHAMEAVMFHPKFARRLVNHCEKNPVSGPMQLVDSLLGYFNKGAQSRYALPHARFMGPEAPVKSVIDPNIGTTVDHDGSTADRLEKDADLFRIVKLQA